YLVQDDYGENLAISNLSIPQAHRQNLDRALALAQRPFSSSVVFAHADLATLHSNLAMCHWMREEFNDALLHLTKHYELVRRLGQVSQESKVVGNIGAV